MIFNIKNIKKNLMNLNLLFRNKKKNKPNDKIIK